MSKIVRRYLLIAFVGAILTIVASAFMLFFMGGPCETPACFARTSTLVQATLVSVVAGIGLIWVGVMVHLIQARRLRRAGRSPDGVVQFHAERRL